MAVQLESKTEPGGGSTPKKPPRIPSIVPLFSPIALRLMRLGVPMGPNVLLTVRGRKSGVERTTPVAMVKVDGRRWIIGTFGEVNWVRNLRAAGEGILTAGRRKESVRAVELSHSETETFFADVLGPYVRRLPLGRWLLGSVLGARDILDDPHGAAAHLPVFELHPPA
jgi:deazaflavin-dependent oxidoreductase (nitroreductase family)